VSFAVGYTERHNGAVLALAEALPQIGRLRHISIRRLGYANSAVDPALNLACHDLDVLDALGFDLEVWHALRVDGHLSLHLAPNAFVSSFVERGEEVCTVSIEASHLHPVKVRTLEAVGTEGVLQLDYQRRTLTIAKDDDAGLHGGALAVDDTEPLITEWRSFLDTGYGSSGTKALALAEAVRNWPQFATLDRVPDGVAYASPTLP
jgi:predicted dehydrogenase